MKNIDEKLNILKDTMAGRKIKIMILGLGSVGGYLLDYLMSSKDYLPGASATLSRAPFLITAEDIEIHCELIRASKTCPFSGGVFSNSLERILFPLKISVSVQTRPRSGLFFKSST